MRQCNLFAIELVHCSCGTVTVTITTNHFCSAVQYEIRSCEIAKRLYIGTMPRPECSATNARMHSMNEWRMMIYWTFEFGDGTGPSGARMDNGLITVHFTCLAALQIPAPCHAFSYFDGPWVHGWKQINKVKGHSTYRSRIHILKFILTNLMSVWPVAVGPSESESWVVSLPSLPLLWMHIFRCSD